MPAIPIALSSAPIVVGIREIRRATSTIVEMSVPAKLANGASVATTATKISVNPASRIPSAISFGVLRRTAPSTRPIIRSRKDSPGRWVISTTIRSERTRVPPVTAERSPPASRITGADSPVIADSSTEAMPSMTVPSPGITSPASTITTSPVVSSAAGISRPSRSRATVVVRIARSASACARPRPSAIASARLPNSTVSQSQTATVAPNQPGCTPSPVSQSTVVNTAETSTTNITGLEIRWRGSSLRNELTSAGRTIAALNGEVSGLRRVGCGSAVPAFISSPRRAPGSGSRRLRPGCR